MFSLPAVSQNFSWPSFSRESFSDLTTRLSRAAPGYFRDFAPAAIAFGSAYFSSAGFRVGCTVLLTAFIVRSYGEIPKYELCSEIYLGNIQKNEALQKARYAAARAVYFRIISSALIAGVFAAVTKSYLVSGGSFFYTAAQTKNVFHLLFGLEDIAIGLGYGAYCAKSYFTEALFFNRAHLPLRERFEQVILGFQDLLNEWDELDKRYTPNIDQRLYQQARLQSLNEMHQLNENQLAQLYRLNQLHQLDNDGIIQLYHLSALELLDQSKMKTLSELNQLHKLNPDQIVQLYRLSSKHQLTEEEQNELSQLKLSHRLNRDEIIQLYHLTSLKQLEQAKPPPELGKLLEELDSDQIYQLYHLNKLHWLNQNELKELCDLTRLNILMGREKLKERTEKILNDIFSASSWDFHHLMEAPGHYPSSLIRAHFAYQAPNLSDQQILETVQRIPGVLTLNFCAKVLPEYRFRALFMPKLLTSERLNEIKTDLEEHVKTLNEPQLSENKFHEVAATIKQYTDEVKSFLDCLKKFSGTILSVKRLQDELDQVRLREDQAREVWDLLTNEREGSLKRHLQRIARAIAMSMETVDDPIEEAWQVLTDKYSLNNVECAELAEKLGLGKGVGWNELNEYLNKKGLPDKPALIRHKIIPEDDKLHRADAKAEVMQRIVDFCGPAVSVSRRSPLSEVEWTQVLKKIAFVSLPILQISLLGLQIYYHPVPTLIGGICTFTATFIILVKGNPRFDPNLLFLRPRDDIYDLAARVSRELFSHSYLRGGFFYGLWVGVNAGAIYARDIHRTIQKNLSITHLL